MKTNRKIVMVANQIKMDDEDSLDVEFWLSKTPAERISEVVRLRHNYFTWTNGSFPDKIENVVHQRKMECSNRILSTLSNS
jgi:hypothetical protein